MTQTRTQLALVFLLSVFFAQPAAALLCTGENSPDFIEWSINATDQTCSQAPTLAFTGDDGHKIIVTTSAPSGNATIAIQVIENGLVKDTAAAALQLSCNNFVPVGIAVSYQTSATAVFAQFSGPQFTANCSLSYLDENGYTVSHDFFAARAAFVGDPTVRGFVGNILVTNGWFDQVAPDVTLSGLSGIAAEPVTILAEFTENVTGFDASDVTLGNLTLSNFNAISGTQYEFDVTAIAGGQATISIGAGGAIDGSGNDNSASNTLSEAVDTSPPDVVISGFPAQITGPTVFDATITFSGPIVGFDAGDITLSGGSVINLAGGDTVFTVTVSATGLADVVMSISADVATNNLGVGNNQSNVVTAVDASPARTSALIAQFMQTRANALLGNQPDLTGLLRGGSAPQFSAEITNNGGIVAFDSGNGAPVWAQLNANWITNSGSESQYVFGAFGGYSKLSEKVLIGAMLQFDFMTEVNGPATISGTGWMIGPYFAAKLPDQPLYFEGSLLYGQSSNTISPLGTFTDSFTTERWLATVGVSGEVERGALVLLPFLDAKYTTDAQAAYIDGLGNPIAAQTIALAQAVAGLDFEFSMNQATTLNGGISGVWSYSSGNAVAPGFEGGRAKVTFGLAHYVGSCSSLALTSFYDGIGAADYESYGAEFSWKSCF